MTASPQGYCINPFCPKPDKPFIPQCSIRPSFCQHCGTRLDLRDQFEILGFLGKGGFGRAFYARDKNAKEKQKEFVAIKQLFIDDPDPRNLEKAKSLFQQEANKLAKLGNHRQLPSLYYHFSQPIENSTTNNSFKQEFLYLVLEFIDGETLLGELKKQGLYNELKIRQFLKKILPILKFLHNEGIIHRDIKPENIMRRSSNDELVLIDFGGIKEFTQTNMGQTGTKLYTAGYAPNEQMKGKAYPASDLYSLGATCIHLMTGTPPSDIYDGTQDKLLWKEELRKKGIKLNPHMQEILEKILQPLVRDRYQKVDEVLEALLPKVEISESRLNIVSTRIGETLKSSITIKNLTPNTQLEGSFQVLPHPSDPPHTPNNHLWIQLQPQSFNCKSSIEITIIVDTSKLAAEKKIERTIQLTTNAYTQAYKLDLNIKTARIISQIKTLPLFMDLSLLFAGGFAGFTCIFYHTILTDTFIKSLTMIWYSNIYANLINQMQDSLNSVWSWLG